MNIALISDDPRTRQYAPFSGGMPGEPMPTGTYIEVRRAGERDLTLNDDCWDSWDDVNRGAQSIAAHPAALKPMITKDLVAFAFQIVNITFANVAARVRTRANRLFSDTFGGPNRLTFEPYPIRWPGENRHAMRIVMGFISSAFQIPQVKSNLLDHGIVDNNAKIILRPLFDLKANMMRQYFGLEIKGEISVDELDAVFRDGGPMPPLYTSLDDDRDLGVDRAAEDARSLTNESAKIPDENTMTKITDGIEVWKFAPEAAHWTLFGRVTESREWDGPNQIPGEPFRFANGTVSSAGSTSPGATPGGATTVTPT